MGRAIDSKPDICIYHAPCQDGFASAWVVWKKFGNTVEFVPGVYGQEPPDVKGKHVLLVDFSYKFAQLLKLSAEAASITILDHHKSAKSDLEILIGSNNINGVFDMDRSGAGIAWDTFFPSERLPKLLRHIQDRDLWKFELDGTREISAALFSYDYDFELFNKLVTEAETTYGWRSLWHEGVAINRQHMKDCKELIKATKRKMIIADVCMDVCNVPYQMASDIGNIMAKESRYKVAATYFDGPEGRKFSLRSVGETCDVSKIATKYGGGGHFNASGFVAPIGWEGDVEIQAAV